jgi:glycosyltransferase involved in cell wall biosynthesis
MSNNKSLTLSLIIPAYNEQRYLKAALDSIAAQTVMPDEVLVVDNNSTDDTVSIASSYNFVKVLHEAQQHQSYAQAKGFAAASSDILGRIDADSILPPNWVENVKAHFQADSGLIAITGSTTPYDISVKSVGTKVFRVYIDFASWLAGCRMLWGANCALRRSAWARVENKVMRRADIWEDYDLSYCLDGLGKMQLVDDIDVDSSFRAVQHSMIAQTRYQFRAVRTVYHHRSVARTSLFLAVWSSMYLIFLLVLLDRYILKPLLRLFSPAATEVEAGQKVVPQVVE